MAPPTASPLKPQFFVLRPNGIQVPLIAMDEVPTNVIVHGVPRILNAEDTAGMISIGEHNSRHLHYDVEFAGSKNSPFEYRPSRSIQSSPAPSSVTTKQIPNGLTMDEGYPAPPKTYGIQVQQPSTPPSSSAAGSLRSTPARRKSVSTVSADTEPPACPSGWQAAGAAPSQYSVSEAALGRKVYCSYWLRRGECDYAQQGCIYKHEMPKDLATLQICGLRDWPQWYRQQYGVPSMQAVPGSGAAGGPANIALNAKLNNNWRSTSDSSPPAVSDALNKSSGHFSTHNSACTPGCNTTRPLPSNAGARHTAAPPGRGSRPATPHNQPLTLTLDQVAANNAYAQLEKSKKEEAKFKAELKARSAHKKATTAETRSPTIAKESLYDSDVSNAPQPGLVTPATSYDSDAGSRANKTQKGKVAAPAAKITSPRALDAKLAGYATVQTEGREETIRRARSNMEVKAFGGPYDSGSASKATKRGMSFPKRRRGHKDGQGWRGNARPQQDHVKEEGLLDFGETQDKANVSWKPDGYDHDD